MTKYKIVGRNWWGYSYDLKDGLPSLAEARAWRDRYQQGDIEGVNGARHNGKDKLEVWSYTGPSYSGELVRDA